jgi:hypothetical protein
VPYRLIREQVDVRVSAHTVEIFHAGSLIAAVIEHQAAHRKHPEETLRSAQGILRLGRDFSPALEQACEHALALRSYSYRAMRTLIEAPVNTATRRALDLAHENVRGPDYFQ